MPRPAPAAPPPPPHRRALPLAAVAVAAAGLFAWWGVWQHGFVFDDHPAIRDHEALLRGDWWQAAFGPRHQPLANRPFACWTLAVDFAVFGPGPFGPHLGNLVLHLADALLLLAVVRRTLLAPNFGGRFDSAGAARLATAVALLWVVHPLATDAVAYATQRSTLLYGGALLASLYGTLRAHGSPRPAAWRALAVGAMALGMASKEDLLLGPVLVVLFERAFLLPDWRALRARRGFHLALAATWLVLAACVAGGPSNPTVGYATTPRVSALEWLLTQAPVVAHYARLSLWPHPLRGAYDWDYVRTLGPAVLPGLVVLALLAAAALAWQRARWQWFGWLGALFFLLLAPTSTVLPIVTEVVAERRAYLPMLFVVVPAVAGLHHVLRGRAAFGLVVAAAAVGLALATRAHAPVYAGEPAFWADAFAKRDPASRSHLAAQILSNHGSMLFNGGRVQEALPLFDQAMACEAPTPDERVHWAVSLQFRGRHDEAIAELERLAAAHPTLHQAHGSLGTCLLQAVAAGGEPRPDDPRLPRAEAALRRALELEPNRVAFWNSLGVVHKYRGQWGLAEAAFARAIALSTERFEPYRNRAEALARLGRAAEIQPMFDRLLAARPRDAALRLQLAHLARAQSDLPRARALLQEVLRLEPGNPQAAALLRDLGAGR